MLVPASLCDGERYGELRRAVTTFAAARNLFDVDEAAFPGIVEPGVALELDPSATHEPSDAPWTAVTAVAFEAPDFLSQLESFPRLPREAFSDPGVHTGNAAPDLIRRGARRTGAALREGRDLSPYRLGPPSACLAADHRARPGQRFRIGALERYRRIPVLLRQTADRPRAALHIDPTYFRNTLLGCSPPPGLDPAFVVAVLNGPLAALWHRARFRDARQRAFPQVKVGHLRTQPFPFLHRAENPRLHDEIARLTRAIAVAPEPPPDLARRIAEIERLVQEAFGVALPARS